MSNYYTTGQFARIAEVSERTIRYYDKIGLLKPALVLDNGYRQYSDADLLKLQKILSLRYFGFSIDEIFSFVLNEKQDVSESFGMQIDLINKKIAHMNILKEALNKTLHSIEMTDFSWSDITNLVKITNQEIQIKEHYMSANSLNVRIDLHEKYSTNRQGWFSWLSDNIDFSKITRALEIGCGNGKLWDYVNANLRNREIFLSDSSEGMVEEVRKKIGKEFNCIQARCENIPFKDNYFDAIVANHVLFYVNDLNEGLNEICRTLKDTGIFYCTTYGKGHMKEIEDIVKKYDERIVLSESNLFDRFGLENGEGVLNSYFSNVTKINYEDKLVLNDVEPLVHYIMSCHGNQNEIIGPKLTQFKLYISELLKKSGKIEITKNAGLFICKNKS